MADSHASITLLHDIGLSIVFAALAGHMARLLRQPMILGYVLGGVLLGAPLGLGMVSNPESIELISEIGLIFLLFIIGLEIDLAEIARMGKTTFVVGLVQFVGCVGLGLGLFAPLGLSASGGQFTLLYLAIACALSSTLVVVKLLHDKAEIHTAAGRLTVGVLVLQDLFAILFMALQPSLLAPQVASIARSLAYGVALVVLTFLLSRFVLGAVMRWAAKLPELVLLTSMGWCFAVAGLAQAAGLSREMGALVAGMSIAAFPYGADVTAKLAGIRDFFVTLFFVSLGLKLPLPTRDTLTVSLVTFGIVLVSRLLTVVPAAWLVRFGLRTGTIAALNLAQVSEFSLVIIGLGVGYGHVTPALQSAVLAAMLLASVLSTYVILFNDHIARRLVRLLHALGPRDRTRAEDDEGGDQPVRDVVILGCFREGLALLDRIEAELPALKPHVLVIDFNPQLKERIEGAGFAWAYGDLAHPETLVHLGLEEARIVVSSIPDTFLKGTSNRRLLIHCQQIAPQARFVFTAEHASGEEDLRLLGAQEVVVPAHLTADRLVTLLGPYWQAPPGGSAADREAATGKAATGP